MSYPLLVYHTYAAAIQRRRTTPWTMQCWCCAAVRRLKKHHLTSWRIDSAKQLDHGRPELKGGRSAYEDEKAVATPGW